MNIMTDCCLEPALVTTLQSEAHNIDVMDPVHICIDFSKSMDAANCGYTFRILW